MQHRQRPSAPAARPPDAPGLRLLAQLSYFQERTTPALGRHDQRPLPRRGPVLPDSRAHLQDRRGAQCGRLP
eukprot:8594741-Alexandrium_andersonii.AAC.1